MYIFQSHIVTFYLKKLIGIILLTINLCLGQNSRDAGRLAYCDSLEKAAAETGNQAQKAEAFYIRGKIASENFEIKESNDWFMKALEIHKNLAPSIDLGKVYGYLASNAILTGNKRDFGYFLEKAEKVYNDLNFKDGLRDVYSKKISLYTGQFGEKPNYHKAIALYKILLSQDTPITYNDSLHVAGVNFHLGWLYLQLNKNTAIGYLKASENIYKKLNNEQIVNCLLTQADAFIKFKEYGNLEKVIKEVNVYEKKIQLDKETQLHYHQTLASYFSFKNKPIESLQNSLVAEQISTNKFEKSKEDFSVFHTKIETIEKQNSMISSWSYIIGIGFVVIVILLGVVLWVIKNYKKKIIEEAKSSLLVQEVNHRIKNNFQTIANLIILQDNELTDPEARKALEETQTRINSLALVHSHLYGKSTLEKVDMEDFLYELSTQLLTIFNKKYVELDFFVKAPPLSSEKAIVLGLITNEWLTNICKYAFKESNRLKISLTEKSSVWRLVIEDFGKSKIEVIKKSSFGIHLIQKLTGQLNGQMIFNEYNNLSEIVFSENQK